MTDIAHLLDEEPEAIRRGKGRPKSYHAANGDKVPSVTTILSRFKESGGLLWWANKQGLEGKTLAEAREGATDVGSLVHKMIEADVHAEPHPEVPEELRFAVSSAYGAWGEWLESTRLQIVATELPLVSEEHRFGGTLDWVLRDSKGRLAIGDIKTSNAIYGEYLMQLAAYGLLWDESEPENPVTGGFHLVRFSKEKGDLEHRHYRELDDEREMFLLLRRCYELDRAIGKRAK